MLGFDDLDHDPNLPVDRNAEIRKAAHIVNGGDAQFPCPECKGTGRFRFRNGNSGPCFKCSGKGKVSKGVAAAAKGKATKEANAAQYRVDHALEIEYLRNASDRGFRLAGDLLDKLDTFGAFTDGQLNLVRKLMAEDAAKRDEYLIAQAAKTASKSGEVDIAAIEALFARAVSNDLKRPMFRTEHLTIKASRHPDVLFVTATNSDTYLGKIKEGKFEARREATAETLDQLRAIATDPQAEAVKYGRLTSCCGICGRGLVDPVSIRTGIGPICAARFGFTFARELNRDDIIAEVNEQAAKPDALPADMRAKYVTPEAKAAHAAANVKPVNDTVEGADAPVREVTGPRAGSKKQIVAEMIMAIGGTTVAAIVERLGVSDAAAKALIGDVKRMGVQVVRHGDVYKVS